MSLQFHNHGTIEGTAIRVENATAYLRYHGQHFWMSKDGNNGQEAPHFKEYYTERILWYRQPFLYCSFYYTYDGNSYHEVIVKFTIYMVTFTIECN